MSTCHECLNLLVDYLDGALADDVKRRLDEHFGECPPCVDFLSTYKETSGLCKKALSAEMPEELSDRLRDFLRAEVSKAKAVESAPQSAENKASVG